MTNKNFTRKLYIVNNTKKAGHIWDIFVGPFIYGATG